MAKSLSFDAGIVEYDVNGAATIRFNPTDAAFIEQFYRALTELDDKQDEFRKKVDAIGEDKEGMFAYAKERDRDMRATIDGMFGEGIADALFPNMNCYSLAGGLPVWMNFMFAVADEIEGAFADEGAKADPRMAEYSAKYDAMMKKYQRR